MKMRHAMVCSSNQNRSMEAHSLLKRHGFDVYSYGTGAHVKLPGPSLREPNVYEFGTPYKHMFDDLRRKDPDLYAYAYFLLHYIYTSNLSNLLLNLSWAESNILWFLIEQVQTQWNLAHAEKEFHRQTCASAVARKCFWWILWCRPYLWREGFRHGCWRSLIHSLLLFVLILS